MHRDHQKPDVYRSLTRTLFVRGEDCERPRYGTGVKPRASSPPAMELPAHGRRVHDGHRPTHIGVREEDMGHRGSSDLQLRHISREAEKLNQMISSWSKSPSFDGRTSDIAAELLKGALELQESLIMLEKLQGASSFMAPTRRRQSCGSTEQEEATVEVTGSRRFGSRRYQDLLEETRIPVDGSSKNSILELKKVIKEDIHQQNLVSISPGDEKASSFRSPKLPSGGGSGDSCGKKGHQTESSCSAAEQKKAKAPSLIARLMGLENTPQEELRPVLPKPQGKTNSSHPRSVFDIEMPKPSKLPSPEEKPEPGRKTLEEIIEAMHFKGLLSVDYGEDRRFCSQVDHHNTRGFHKVEEIPPILIIRPMQKMEEMQRDPVEVRHASLREKGQFFNMEEEASMERVVSRGIDNRNGKYLAMEKVHGERLKPMVPREIGTRAKKFVVMEKHVEEVSEPALPRNLEKRAQKSVVMEKLEEPSEKNKTSGSSYLKQLKMETNRTQKEPDEVPKPVLDRLRSENRSTRSVTVSGTPNKTAPSIPGKPERRPARARSQVSTQTSASNHEDRRPTKPTSMKAVDAAKAGRTAEAKNVGEPSTAVDSPSSKEENVETIPAEEKVIPTISPTSSSNPLRKETDHNSITSKGDIGKEPSFHCGVMPKRGSHGAGSSPPAHTDKESSTTAAAEITYRLKRLLLSSPSFLRHAQELFNICHHQPVDCHRTETKQTRTVASKLLLGFASELMAARSGRSQLLYHPLSPSSLKGPERKISMNQLVEEISQDMENLTGYSRGGPGGDAAVSGNSFYGRLERDLKCNRVFGRGVWDQGWIEAVPVEEADRIVQDVEVYVVEMLVEEIAMELVW